MNRDTKVKVILFSDANFLALNLLETLLTKNCLVSIVSNDIEQWQVKTNNLQYSSRFLFLNFKEYKELSDFNYAIFCGGFIDREKSQTDFKKFISGNNLSNTKTLAIFPFETFSLTTSSKILISDNAGIIYLGDLMGPRIDLESNLLFPTLINEMLEKRTATLGIGEVFFPLFIADASRTIVKWLLSFGPYGKDTFLLGPRVSSEDFCKLNIKTFNDLKVQYSTNINPRFIPKGYETVIIPSNLNICFNETYRWVIKEKLSVDNNSKFNVINTPNKKPILPKTKNALKIISLRLIITPFILVLLFPLIASFISGSFLYLSYRQFLSDKIDGAKNSALFARNVFRLGNSESDFLAKIPLIGRIYKEVSFITLTGDVVADIAYNAIPLAENGRQILSGVLNSGIYDIQTPSNQIKTGFKYINQQIVFLQNNTKNNSDLGILSAKQTLQLVDFDKFKMLSSEGGVLAGNLPSILGQDINKNYLILFENNMELRPTGGFIGSYGVANFGGGKLNGLTVNDIYSADGQLKGHVEPPLPIKKYLNEANWWFRDSNWDPDFPTSAGRAEWFLNKETDQTVDGVIAIDLNPIKKILSYTGPIFLPDYNFTINSDNLYEKTQEEAQANSFPGSRQKASFLTALSRTLLTDISKMNAGDRILVLRSIYESLEARHFQVYLHDQQSASSISKLGWDGGIQNFSCGESCYSDFFGDVEANVGVNKSNYFIKRKIDFSVNIDSQKITRQLTINLTNSANPSLGLSGIYNTYMRIMIPSDSKVISATNMVSQNEINLSPEITQEKGRQEVGVMVRVTPGETRNIKFVWQNTLPANISSYGLYVRKQAGVDPDPLQIKFSGMGSLVSNPIFSLTKGGMYTYNTNLTQDFFARLSW